MKSILLNLFILFVFNACISQSQQTGSSTIEVKTYKQMLEEKKDYQLLDVRTSEEFKEEHLTGAKNIDYNGNDFEKELANLDKTKPTFIYCLSGGRSGQALEQMIKLGFKEVYNLNGGILKWKAANLPLSKEETSAGWKGMSAKEFETITQNELPVLIDFNASWCAPCKQLKPILESMTKKYANQIVIVPIDIDVNKSLAETMHIEEIPFLQLYKSGKLISSHQGILDEKSLVEFCGLK